MTLAELIRCGIMLDGHTMITITKIMTTTMKNMSIIITTMTTSTITTITRKTSSPAGAERPRRSTLRRN